MRDGSLNRKKTHAPGDSGTASTRARSGGAARSRVKAVGRLALIFLLGCGAGAWWLAGSPADAQAGQQQGLLVAASELRLKPGMETPLDLAIDADRELPRQAILIIRGMPPGMQLSEGRAFGPGVWVVPASELANVKLRTPMDPKTGGLLSVSLATPDGVSLDEASIMLVIQPPAAEKLVLPPSRAAASLDAPVPLPKAAPPSPRIVPPPPAAGTAPSAKLTAEERASLLTLFAKGEENLSLGNILVARQFFQRAAERGLAEAAIALATTYDARELARIKTVSGVAPDAKLALKWYERAWSLGSTEAALRLRQLPQP
jgi:hypothetical protein